MHCALAAEMMFQGLAAVACDRPWPQLLLLMSRPALLLLSPLSPSPPFLMFYCALAADMMFQGLAGLLCAGPWPQLLLLMLCPALLLPPLPLLSLLLLTCIAPLLLP